MAPKAKKRVKRASPPTIEHFKPLPSVNASEAVHQDSKALHLPIELLTEILSYLKSIPRPSEHTFSRRTTNKEYLERTDTLRALSQTCRRWRHVFFHTLWESLDVWATHSKSGAWYQTFGETLIRKSSLMTANKEIASCVRTVNVILTRYSASTVLPAFVQGLEALPNMKVLCIAGAHSKMTTALKDAFEDHTFPQVETIFLPPQAHNILRSCPLVRKVVCNDPDEVSTLITAIAKECEHVEEVEGFSLREERTMKRLVKAIPNLRSMKFRHPVAATVVEPLSEAKNLSHITIQSVLKDYEEVTNTPAEMASIKAATDIIRNSPAKGRKSVVLSFCPDYAFYFYHPMPEPWSKTWVFDAHGDIISNP